MAYLVRFILMNTGDIYKTIVNEIQLRNLILTKEILITDVEMIDFFLEYDKIMQLIKQDNENLEFGIN